MNQKSFGSKNLSIQEVNDGFPLKYKSTDSFHQGDEIITIHRTSYIVSYMTMR